MTDQRRDPGDRGPKRPTRAPRRSRTRVPVIGIVGTFDVANFGDLLFPEIAAVELGRRLGPLEMRRFSPRRMASPPWPYEVGSIDDLAGSLDELDLLLVGGGHLVRFDHAVAPGYGATATAVPHPTGYWLSPTLAAVAQGVPVAWNALGASADIPGWARPLLASALRAVDYRAVRDRRSLEALESIAPGVKVDLVPDTGFGIVSVLTTAGNELPASIPAVIRDHPYVIVQASAGLRGFADRLPDAIAAAHRAGRTVVELPISPVLGDRIGTVGPLGDVVAVDPWPTPLDLARLIGGAQVVVAQSMHLTIVALAHGVPVIRPVGKEGTKYADLDELPGVRVVRADEDLADMIAASAAGSPSPRIVESVAQLEHHWDRIAALVREDGPSTQASRRQVGSELMVSLPATLESAEVARAAGVLDAEQEATELRERLTALEGEQRSLLEREASRSVDAMEAARHAAELAERVGRLDAELTSERTRSAADRRLADQEIRRAREQQEAAQATAREARSKAAAYDRLRARRTIRFATRAVRTFRRAMRAIGIDVQPPRSSVEPARIVAATAAEAAAMQAALLRDAPGSARVDGPKVSIIVLNRDGLAHLRRLLPAVADTTYRAFDLIVVDNGSGDGSVDELRQWTSRLPMQVITNTENRSFSDANGQAVAIATGDHFLFLNNDIEPVGPGWLGHMVDMLEAHDAAAVGARLVYPRRGELDNTGDLAFPDLTLQHRGIHFVAADGVPTGRNLGPGTDPLAPVAGRVGEAAAVTAACLLVRRAAFASVGGFSEAYRYGSEDVDLMMKIRASGGRIVYDGGAALWHHEYGTQNAQGRDWKRQNRMKNRQAFVDRWAPQAFRTVFRDRLEGAQQWSETPFHVAITVTRDDPAAGWGDYYTAHELGGALEALDWQVSYIERHRDRWYDLDPTIDVVVALLDSFDVRRVSRGIVTVAWIRNWTERWVEQPWFDEFDILLASSLVSQQIVAARSDHEAAIMPLATNPERFSPGAPAPAMQSDVAFVGNRWGVPRAIEDVLPPVSRQRRVRVFGRGWADSALASVAHGPVAYDQLVDVYRSAKVVVDDTAGPTLPYGAVNSRVFDALAAGALVVSDNEIGVRELFGDDFPIATDAAGLESILDWAERDPQAAERRQAALRDQVLERHTYRHRAEEVRGHLRRWVEAERYAILIGPPDWERAPTWGDYHFARGLQRQFEARGHPTRIHLLDEWDRSPAARADVAIHLHGLSDHRPRPSQFNILWVISHPDRVTPAMCDRYDLVFVASDTFAASLASQTKVPVHVLHQATDPDRFHPVVDGPAHELLFAANTRNVRRSVVDDLIPTVHELAIYGKGWTPEVVDPVHVRGEYIANRDLHRYYSAAGIVLNDHWPDMRSWGFLSNRLYDALAAGAFVISDPVAGINDEFDGAIVTYDDATDLRGKVDKYLADPTARQALADRGREIVLARHTFAHRVDRILDEVAAFELPRPRDIERWSDIDRWLRRRQLRTAGTAASVPAGRAPIGVGPP